MYNNSMHEMTLETIYPSGAEEWLCPICFRRIILDQEMVVLETGENVGHFGGAVAEEDISALEELSVLEELLSDIDFSELDDG